MPLPVGHGLMGYALYETVTSDDHKFDGRMVLLFAFIANSPDLDFLPGFLVGDPNRYHHSYFSHSLGFAILVGFACALFFKWREGRRFLPGFLIFTGVCFSHMILDFMTADTREPFGLPILWPFSSEYFYSPISLFMSVNKGGPNWAFLKSVFVVDNLLVVIRELAVLLPIIVVIKLVKAKAFKLVREAKKKAPRRNMVS